jgi:hypothetical protein
MVVTVTGNPLGWPIAGMPTHVYDVLWRRQFGDDQETPLALHCDSPSTTRAQQIEIERNADRWLWEFQADGRRRQEIDNAFAVLAGPDHEFNLRWQSDQPFRAMAAHCGGRQVVAKLDDRGLSIRSAPGRLADELVDLLPPARPARQHSESVSATELSRIDVRVGSGDQNGPDLIDMIRTELSRARERPQAIETFIRLAREAATGRGEFGLARRTPWRQHSVPRALLVNDTASGRYSISFDRDQYGEDFVTVNRGDRMLLIGRLNQLHDGLPSS